MKNKNYLFHKLLMLVIVCLSIMSLSACGNKMSGTYTAENPDNPDILIQSMTFDGGEVILHLRDFGIGNLICEYKIKDDKLLIGDSITIDNKTLPSSYKYVKIDKKTIELDGVRYILSE